MGQVENYNNPTAYLRGLVSPMISFNGKHLEKSETLYHYKSLLLAIQTVCTGDDILYFCKIPSGNCKYTGAIERINCFKHTTETHIKEGQSDTLEIIIQELVTYACFLFMIYRPYCQ